MESNEKYQENHLAEFTDQLLRSEQSGRVPKNANGEEKELEDIIRLLAQIVKKDQDQGVKNRVRLKATSVFLEQQKRRKQSILSNVFQPLRQVFQQRKAVYALITISAFIIGISAVLLLAVPGLSGPLTGSVLGEETITWILIVISCISTLILLLLILLKK